MTIDLQKFYQATNPSKTLRADDPQDQKYYVDFSSVRGGKLIEELKWMISSLSPDEPTCTLFTGHIGCGKSTELLQLKQLLEAEGFHVVYFESSEDLEMADVDIGDVLLAIAKRISESLESVKVNSSAAGLRKLLEKTKDVLLTEIDIKAKAEIPGLGKASVDSKGKEISLSAGIAELTVIAKNDAGLREKLNQFLAPQKNKLLDAINQELIQPAIGQLKQQGKKGLAVIVDNLDRVDKRIKPSGRQQQEYLFIDQSECLTKLQCHLVYTIPLSLKFSNEYGSLTQRYDDPKVLPMVPVMTRANEVHEEGMALLQQMVLRRALPDGTDAERMARVGEVFDSGASLARLCRISGGHSRDLLRLLNAWIKKGQQLPLAVSKLEEVIRERRNEMTLAISEDEWALLRQVRQRKKVSGEQDYQMLISSRWVFEYRQDGESWFDVNPILLEAAEMQGDVG
jgi:energy-coupling factor transporter ATP-binding protein EcfA2